MYQRFEDVHVLRRVGFKDSLGERENDGAEFESYSAAFAAVSQDRKDDSVFRASANASITSRPLSATNSGCKTA